MAVRTIKHVSFSFRVPYPDPIRPGETIYAEVKARKGTVVDIPFEDDLERGHKFGAFEEDVPTEFTAPAEAPEAEEESVSVMTVSELVDWIRNDKPTVSDTVDAAEGDPENARKLLEAEDVATGGNSRQGVISGLTAIVSQGQ